MKCTLILVAPALALSRKNAMDVRGVGGCGRRDDEMKDLGEVTQRIYEYA